MKDKTDEAVDIITDESLDDAQKRAALDALGVPRDTLKKELARRIREEEAGLDVAQGSLEQKQARLNVAVDLNKWAALQNKEGLRLERNDCSRLHRLMEAQREERVVSHESIVAYADHSHDMPPLRQDGPQLDFERRRDGMRPQVIVVQHNWAAAFGAELEEAAGDEWNLPYPYTIFEFRANGRNVILVSDQEDGSVVGFIAFVESVDGYWYAPYEFAEKYPVFQWLRQQVKGICVALDAEVAVREVVRAPSKLNAKRERAGKPLLSDFHMVRLNRKPRVNRVASLPGQDYTHKRLHFRRGHWRHFQNGTKTWIRWALVGDPDLGFIDKEYCI